MITQNVTKSNAYEGKYNTWNKISILDLRQSAFQEPGPDN